LKVILQGGDGTDLTSTRLPSATIDAIYVRVQSGADAKYIIFVQSGVVEGPTVSKIGPNTTQQT
jgi:hypothetical protein